MAASNPIYNGIFLHASSCVIICSPTAMNEFDSAMSFTMFSTPKTAKSSRNPFRETPEGQSTIGYYAKEFSTPIQSMNTFKNDSDSAEIYSKCVNTPLVATNEQSSPRRFTKPVKLPADYNGSNKP